MLRGEIKEESKEPLIGQGVAFPYSQSTFIGHPDPSVDVAVMNVSVMISSAEQAGQILFWKNVTKDNFPNDEHYEKFIGPMEEVIFIGYPSGIWDQKNILPVTRRGLTATPCYTDFNGEKVFLIDASVFPGSSGSPVFIYYAGGHPDKAGGLYAGNRMHFLGLVAKVYQRQEQGEIKVIDIPTNQKAVAEVNQMIDLGIVYKAETILEATDHYLKVANASNK